MNENENISETVQELVDQLQTGMASFVDQMQAAEVIRQLFKELKYDMKEASIGEGDSV